MLFAKLCNHKYYYMLLGNNVAMLYARLTAPAHCWIRQSPFNLSEGWCCVAYVDPINIA